MDEREFELRIMELTVEAMGSNQIGILNILQVFIKQASWATDTMISRKIKGID